MPRVQEPLVGPATRDPRLMLRPATPEDRDDWLRLRNDPEARFWSGTTTPILPAQHAEWFARVLSHPHHQLFVDATDEERVGYGRLQLRLDAEVSLAVDADFRGQGRSQGILQTLEGAATEAGASRLVAVVHPGNIASLRAFLRQGYAFDGHQDFQRLVKPLPPR